MILLFLLKYQEFVKIRIFKIFSAHGYIHIKMITDNKRILDKYIKLDEYNTFVFGKVKKRKFCLEDIQKYIIGYDKYSFPVFIYDKHFILPLKVTTETIGQEIKKQVDLNKINNNPFNMNDDEKVSALTMLIDSAILYTVYNKKLLSDLYSITQSGDIKNKIFWIVVIAIVLLVAYYTGILDKILSIVMGKGNAAT